MLEIPESDAKNFMPISKMQTCLSDKMHPKKLKFKNEKNGT
jgi:hypothetical protein